MFSVRMRAVAQPLRGLRFFASAAREAHLKKVAWKKVKLHGTGASWKWPEPTQTAPTLSTMLKKLALKVHPVRAFFLSPVALASGFSSRVSLRV